MAKKEGHSEEGFFGNIIHYDAQGHKIGESWPGFFGGYNNYDANGRKTGESWPGLFGEYKNYDEKGHKTGESWPGFFGGQVHEDAQGHRIGTSEQNFFGGQSHYGSFGGGAGIVNSAGSAAGLCRDDQTRMAEAAASALSKPAGECRNDDDGSRTCKASAAPSEEKDEAAETAATVRYIIASSPSQRENIYYRTNDPTLAVGNQVCDAKTGELMTILAVVDCQEDDLPPDARTARFVEKA